VDHQGRDVTNHLGAYRSGRQSAHPHRAMRAMEKATAKLHRNGGSLENAAKERSSGKKRTARDKLNDKAGHGILCLRGGEIIRIHKDSKGLIQSVLLRRRNIIRSGSPHLVTRTMQTIVWGKSRNRSRRSLREGGEHEESLGDKPRATTTTDRKREICF